jgi:3-oxoacyl-[acyl-carrier protein] reductase
MKRKIVITGASSEIGLAIAKKTAAPGDELLLQYCRRAGGCEELAKSRGGKAVRADFTSPEELAAFCAMLDGADILVNAAAVTRTGLLPDMEPADISAMLAVNIRALTQTCAAVIPAMCVKRSGIIINISSVTAFRAARGQSVYAGTKGFMESFTRALAAEYSPRGVRANCVAPGAIEAGSLKDLLASGEKEVKAAVALGRLGTPEDVAEAVAFLCGPGGAFMTGQVLRVDGGFRHGL